MCVRETRLTRRNDILRTHVVRRRENKDHIIGVDAPPVSMEAIDQAAELTKGKVAEGGAATDDAVKKAVVGPAQ